jgi:hypothetical protein
LKEKKTANLLIRNEGVSKRQDKKNGDKVCKWKKNWAFKHKKPILIRKLKGLGHEIELNYFDIKG